MGDLIWVGNTLLPRGVVILGVVLIVMVIAGVIVAINALVERSSTPPTPDVL